MAKLESFLPYVALHCMGVPEPSMLHEIRAAAVLFCERTRIWKERSNVNVRVGQSDYELPLPDAATTVVLEEVFFASNRLDPVAMDDLRERWRHWQDVKGDPVVYTQLNPDIITLVPKPSIDLAKGLSIRACYKPDRSARDVPDWIFQQYAEVISAGAISRLTAINSLPCFNPDVSAAFGRTFYEGMNKALHEADKSFTRAPRRTAPRFL